MARIEFESTENNGGGWSPLPNGDYVIQFDTVEQTVSKAKNAQLKCAGHVVDGPHDGAKCTVWVPMTEKTMWRVEQLVAAALDPSLYTKTDTGQIRERTMKNGETVEEPIYAYDFDTDDLVGAQVLYTVTQREYEGKVNNDFNNPRSTREEKAEETAPVTRAAAAKPVAAVAKTTTVAAKPAAAVAQPARRRVGG